jgi:hypothetical protein
VGKRFSGYGSYAYWDNGANVLKQVLIEDNGYTEWSRRCPIVDGNVYWDGCGQWTSRDLRTVLGSFYLFAEYGVIYYYPLEEVSASERRHLRGIGMFWSDWVQKGESNLTNYLGCWKDPSDPGFNQVHCDEFDQKQMNLIRQAGGTTSTIGFDWINIEATPGHYDPTTDTYTGTYNWSVHDKRVHYFLSRGLSIYAYIGNTPAWAHPSTPNKYGHEVPPDDAPEFRAAWKAFCKAVAQRYTGKVEHFSFWNEPNGCSWRNGCSNGDSYGEYTKWLKITYEALKSGNPNAKVAGGALDCHEGVNCRAYVEGMYHSGAKGFLDAIAIHPYAWAGVNWNAIHDTRNVMVNRGDGDKEIWLNEYGWASSWEPVTTGYLQGFLETIKRPEYGYVTMTNYLIISDLNDGNFGLCDRGARDLECRPIYYTYMGTDKTLE